MSEEKSQQTSESSQKEGTTSTLKKGAGIVATMASKVRRKRGTTISKDNLVHVSCHTSLGSHDSHMTCFS